MDRRAILPVDVGFCTGIILRAPPTVPKVPMWDPCPFGLPEILTVAQCYGMPMGIVVKLLVSGSPRNGLDCNIVQVIL